jgi:ADP-ribose pyrophosphatase YjhB (NUDIX family)
VVFDRRGRVALVKQRDRAFRLRWTLPKGRLEAGETARAAALREVREETGLSIRIASYVGLHEGKRRVTHYFTMVLLRAGGVPDDETAEVRFVWPQDAARMLRSARDRAVLALARLPRRGATS